MINGITLVPESPMQGMHLPLPLSCIKQVVAWRMNHLHFYINADRPPNNPLVVAETFYLCVGRDKQTVLPTHALRVTDGISFHGPVCLLQTDQRHAMTLHHHVYAMHTHASVKEHFSL